MWNRNQDKVLWSLYWENQGKTQVCAVSRSCLLCYRREWVKSEEKEILQLWTTSLNIHFICHPRIISHAPMYHLNILPWSYTPPSQLLINNTTPYHPMSRYLRPCPHHHKSYRHHLTTSSCHLHIYQRLHSSVTQIPSIHTIQFLSTPQSITHNPNHDSIPLLVSRFSKNNFQWSWLLKLLLMKLPDCM